MTDPTEVTIDDHTQTVRALAAERFRRLPPVPAHVPVTDLGMLRLHMILTAKS